MVPHEGWVEAEHRGLEGCPELTSFVRLDASIAAVRPHKGPWSDTGFWGRYADGAVVLNELKAMCETSSRQAPGDLTRIEPKITAWHGDHSGGHRYPPADEG